MLELTRYEKYKKYRQQILTIDPLMCEILDGTQLINDFYKRINAINPTILKKFDNDDILSSVMVLSNHDKPDIIFNKFSNFINFINDDEVLEKLNTTTNYINNYSKKTIIQDNEISKAWEREDENNAFFENWEQQIESLRKTNIETYQIDAVMKDLISAFENDEKNISRIESITIQTKINLFNKTFLFFSLLIFLLIILIFLCIFIFAIVI